MKKILYTLIATLLLISCQDDMMHSLPTTDEGLVTLNVSLQVPEMKKSGSRAFGETNLDYMAGCSLQMVVFDGNGYLREWLNPLEADAPEGSIGISDINKDEANGEIDFKVTLSKAVSYRNIHFIVNSPKSSYDFGDEATLISSLSVALNEQGIGQDAYWQQVAFPNGIDDDKATKELMTRVPMIRNFAKITVEDNADNFTLEGFAVVNVWDKGTVLHIPTLVTQVETLQDESSASAQHRGKSSTERPFWAGRSFPRIFSCVLTNLCYEETDQGQKNAKNT